MIVNNVTNISKTNNHTSTQMFDYKTNHSKRILIKCWKTVIRLNLFLYKFIFYLLLNIISRSSYCVFDNILFQISYVGLVVIKTYLLPIWTLESLLFSSSRHHLYSPTSRREIVVTWEDKLGIVQIANK